MANYLIRQGNTWSVKVPIPVDLQPVFGKKAFKQALKTSDKSEAIIRSGPPIADFKAKIETARRDPSDALKSLLKSTLATLKSAASNPETKARCPHQRPLRRLPPTR